MPAVFYHIAVGRFGAEVLGKLYCLVKEESVGGGIGVLSHQFLWMGPGARPIQAAGLGDVVLPVWTFPDPRLVLPVSGSVGPDVGMRLDRTTLAREVADAIVQEGSSLGQSVRSLFQNQATGAIHIVLCGSLAEPADSAIILGLLEGFARLRAIGETWIPTVHVVAGVGAAGSHLAGDEATRRAMAARGLLDLQSYLSKPDEGDLPNWRFAPVYLGGEGAAAAGGGMGRPEQIALAAYTVLGIALETDYLLEDRRQAQNPDWQGRGWRPTAMPWPFSLGRTGAVLTWGSDPEVALPHDRNNPFAVCGGHAVLHPRKRLARLLAARFCGDFFQKLSLQSPLGGPVGKSIRLYKWIENHDEGEAPASGKFPTQDQQEFLRKCATKAATLGWQNLLERITSHAQQKSLGVVDWKALEQVVGSSYEDPALKRLLQLYGQERFLRLPLDDWEQAMAEFETLIEQGFHSRRLLRFQRLEQELPLAVGHGVKGAWDELFATACVDPRLGLEPHRLAEALLGISYQRVERLLDDFEKARIHAPADGGDNPEGLSPIKDELLKKIAQVPSPFAVYVRSGLILAGCLGIALSTPLPDSLSWVQNWMRIVLGGGVSAFVVGYLVQKAHAAKKELLKQVTVWIDQYQLFIEARDEQERRKSMEKALAEGLEALKKLPAGTQLTNYQKELQETARKFRELQGKLLEAFQPSRLETYVPNLSPNCPELFDQEYLEHLPDAQQPAKPAHGVDPSSAGQAAINLGPRGGQGAQPAAVQTATEDQCKRVLGDLRDVAEKFPLPQGRKPFELCIPHALLRMEDAGLNTVPDWCNWKPTGEGISATKEGDRVPAMEFHASVAEYYFVHRMINQTLKDCLAKLPDVDINRMVESMRQVRSSVGGTHPVGQGFLMQFFAKSDLDDPIASGYGNQTHPDNRLGGDRLTMLLNVGPTVSAGTVIFDPNETAPTSPLGLAWRSTQGGGSGNPAMQACDPVRK